MAERKRRTRSSQEQDSIADNDTEIAETKVGNYFSKRTEALTFIPTGCTLLDCVLGGGWPLGRISNVVADRSGGKTLLAIEASANFYNQFDSNDIHYLESEAAFDQSYAKALGCPVDSMHFPEEIYTVEDVFEYITQILKNRDATDPGLVVIDSLDALSDRAEQERDMDEGTYGASKAKKLSEMFRRITRLVEKNNMHIMFISQVRDNIGVSFGRKVKRSGGKALDFYASQILYLSHVGQITKTRKGIKRTTGVEIKAKCDKNKVGMPFRECQFSIMFGYGVDRLAANIDWLLSTKNLDAIDLSEAEAKKTRRNTMTIPEDEFVDLDYRADEAVKKLWYEAEEEFLPSRTKY